jgi:hypothetical protein
MPQDSSKLQYQIAITLSLRGDSVVDRSYDVNEERYRNGPMYVGKILSMIVDIAKRVLQSGGSVDKHIKADMDLVTKELEQANRCSRSLPSLREIWYMTRWRTAR